MLTTCIECGAPIPRRFGRRAKATAKFCGNLCKYAYQRVNPPRLKDGKTSQPCEICGEVFEYYPSGRPSAKYCSVKCKGIAHSAIMTGRRYVEEYSKPSTFRKWVRNKFVNRCAICGWGQAPCDIAHIVARKDGGPDDFENIVMLCPNHHRLFDRGKISIEKIVKARPNCLPPPSH